MLLDANEWSADDAGTQLRLCLSAASEPAIAAAWLEGFLNRNALVLLHDDQVWSLVDEWFSGLGEAHFATVLPIVRRTFSGFQPADRRSLGERARRFQGSDPGLPAAAKTAAPTIDPERAAVALPLLRRILGLP